MGVPTGKKNDTMRLTLKWMFLKRRLKQLNVNFHWDSFKNQKTVSQRFLEVSKFSEMLSR